MNSINLTIFNKEALLKDVLDGIFNNTVEKFEIICVLDGCTDNSEKILQDYIYNSKNKNLQHFNIFKTDNVFETRANNVAAKASQGDYVIIVQDDCVITEYGFDERILRPFRTWNDIFAVTGNCAHNWQFFHDSKDIHREPHSREWCDIMVHLYHANKHIVGHSRDIFYIRDSVNRGPLAINRKDLETMGYFSEEIVKQDMDDHLLMLDMQLKLGKKVGYYNIGFESKLEWGSTRENLQPKPWLLAANNINTRLLYDRHKETIKRNLIEQRELK